MPKQIVYELYAVEAKSADEAKAEIEKKAGKRKVIVVAASSLGELAHPVHLDEAQRAFGAIGGKQ